MFPTCRSNGTSLFLQKFFSWLLHQEGKGPTMWKNFNPWLDSYDTENKQQNEALMQDRMIVAKIWRGIFHSYALLRIYRYTIGTSLHPWLKSVSPYYNVWFNALLNLIYKSICTLLSPRAFVHTHEVNWSQNYFCFWWFLMQFEFQGDATFKNCYWECSFLSHFMD